MLKPEDYLKKLKQRAKESHVYKKYQLVGLEIAQALGDEKHRALYIKLAKEGDGEALLRLAKEVADRRGVRNRGAYFMRLAVGKPKTVWGDLAGGDKPAKNLFTKQRVRKGQRKGQKKKIARKHE
jgi:hypothetical protein